MAFFQETPEHSSGVINHGDATSELRKSLTNESACRRVCGQVEKVSNQRYRLSVDQAQIDASPFIGAVYANEISEKRECNSREGCAVKSTELHSCVFGVLSERRAKRAMDRNPISLRDFAWAWQVIQLATGYV